VFFPNGKLSITAIEEKKKNIEIEIDLRSKDLKSINTIGNQIISIHHQIENMYSTTDN